MSIRRKYTRPRVPHASAARMPRERAMFSVASCGRWRAAIRAGRRYVRCQAAFVYATCRVRMSRYATMRDTFSPLLGLRRYVSAFSAYRYAADFVTMRYRHLMPPFGTYAKCSHVIRATPAAFFTRQPPSTRHATMPRRYCSTRRELSAAAPCCRRCCHFAAARRRILRHVVALVTRFRVIYDDATQ